MPKNSDNELVNELFKTYRQMMYKIALGILHNKSDVEDVVQDAFLWIINNLEKVSQIPRNKRAVYFANIIEHLSLNVLNKRRVHPTEDIDEHEELCADISVEQASAEKITIEEIKRVIRTMPETDRLILRLYLFEERGFKEIADIAGISEGNARIKVYRARKRLAKLLKERGIDYEY